MTPAPAPCRRGLDAPDARALMASSDGRRAGTAIADLGVPANLGEAALPELARRRPLPRRGAFYSRATT